MQFNFDDIKIPDDKLNHTVTENLKLVQSMHKKRRFTFVTTMAAAFAVALLGILCVSNPVLASKIPVIRHIFEKIQDDQRYPGNFDEVATVVADTNTCESDGVTLTLSEIYCTPEALYVSAVLESEEAFSEEIFSSSVFSEQADSNINIFLDYTQKFDFMASSDEQPSDEEYLRTTLTTLDLQGKFENDHTFIGSFRIDFHMGLLSSTENIPDAFHWILQVNRIFMNLPENTGHTIIADGEWAFANKITVDTSKYAVTEINETAPNGIVYTTLTLTPYDARLDSTFDESKVQPGYENIDSVVYVMLDADNKLILNKVGFFSPVEYNLSEMTIYHFPPGTNDEYVALQEKVRAESGTPQVREYLESIAVDKIVIHPNLPEE